MPGFGLADKVDGGAFRINHKVFAQIGPLAVMLELPAAVEG